MNVHPKVFASTIVGVLLTLASAIANALASHHGPWTAAGIAAGAVTLLAALAGYLTPGPVQALPSDEQEFASPPPGA